MRWRKQKAGDKCGDTRGTQNASGSAVPSFVLMMRSSGLDHRSYQPLKRRDGDATDDSGLVRSIYHLERLFGAVSVESSF